MCYIEGMNTGFIQTNVILLSHKIFIWLHFIEFEEMCS